MNRGRAFGQARDAYVAYRPQYPAALFEAILAFTTSNQRSLAVDLGAGTGLSAYPLLDFMERVVAVEPDPQMAEQITTCEALELIMMTAEEVSFEPGSVDLVTVGTAFYWMNGKEVLRKAADWLKPAGVLALYRYALPAMPDAVQKLIDREFEAHWNHFRDPRLLDETYTYRCLTDTECIEQIQRTTIPTGIEMTAEELSGFFRSTSYGSQFASSRTDGGAYWSKLSTEIREAGGDAIAVKFPLELLLGRTLSS